MSSKITKVSSHPVQNEPLIFEVSRPGRTGYRLPALDVEERLINELVPSDLIRTDDLEGMPEVSEVDVIRHFTRLSTWNYSIDLGLYPLGSCT
ncbi:MAG: aminomethyl-transferring glycine dehydrogenase subunit GcvPB, partial [Pyrinomonadaceae bacterium]